MLDVPYGLLRRGGAMRYDGDWITGRQPAPANAPDLAAVADMNERT